MSQQAHIESRQYLASLDTSALHKIRKEMTTQWFVTNRLKGRISPESIAIKRQIDEVNTVLVSKTGERGIA